MTVDAKVFHENTFDMRVSPINIKVQLNLQKMARTSGDVGIFCFLLSIASLNYCMSRPGFR